MNWQAWCCDRVFAWRRPIIAVFALLTLLLLASASQLHIDAGYNKRIPLEHPYMQVFAEHADTFGGANRILVALRARDGNMFTPEFFHTLEKVTDRVFFMPGVDRAQVRSLFTPNVRYMEVVEEGLRGGNVIPADFDYTQADLETVYDNILKADIVGRLVASDFSGALVSARLLEVDPNTGERLDYLDVADYLETEIRQSFGSSDSPFDIHIIGFAPLVGAIADGATQVAFFFLAALLVTYLLVALYAQSWRLALLPVACSLIAVVWQLGLLPWLGLALDPMSMLVPFIVFAVGVSHGIQMLSGFRASLLHGEPVPVASRATFRELLLPGLVALLSDTIGFVTILAIDIGIIHEMALTASLGVAVIILTNLLLLPLLLTGFSLPSGYEARIAHRQQVMSHVWQYLARLTLTRNAMIVLVITALLFIYGFYAGSHVHIGDRQPGVPELRMDAQYNQDSRLIADKFSVGIDILTVFAETRPQGCTDYAVMQRLDDFAWRLKNHPGVHSVQTLPQSVKHIHAGLNEGSLKWFTIPRNSSTLALALSYIPTSTGLLNSDCSVMPVIVYMRDHRSETINSVIAAIEQYRQQHADTEINYELAGGNVGVMAATNDEIAAAQFPILFYVYSAVILLCLISFRSIAAVICIVLPLILTSLLTYALMSHLQIGLKVNTLPVVALGVGIGVDYGIYIFSRLRGFLDQGLGLQQAYYQTLSSTGFGVLITALTLAVGVLTWICSPLQFQVDMGMLLAFMFMVSMLGAVIILPALARMLLPVNPS